MRFNEFNEGIDPSAKAAIKGMRELSGDQYYGLYKTMKDVAGHDGKKQTAPEGKTDHEVSDKPFAYAYTEEEKNMIKGVDPKAKQITSDKSEELDEDFDPTRKQRLDDLIDQYRNATDPIGYDDDASDPDEVIAQIRQEFGDKIANDLEQGPSSHFPRDNHRSGYDPLSHSSSPRVTKSGMANRQDISTLKGNLKQRMGSHNRPNLPEQSMAEGEGDLATALSKLSGSWSGWHKEEDMSSPDIDVYEYVDGEGGYYGRGTIEHNLKSGEVKVEYHDSENEADVVGTFKNMGDAMRALRGGGGNHGGQAPNFDRLGQRKQHGPNDLRKTDRTGRKGTLAGGPTNSLKQAIQWNKGKHGPVGKLPEAGNNYHANRMGFTKPSGHRDDERHDLDAPRPLIYGLKINGKIWKKDGNTVTFFTRERAMAAKNSMLNKRPELEITLVQRPQD